MSRSVRAVLATALLVAPPAAAQDQTPELTTLRQAVATMRTKLAATTEAAEYAAALMTRNPAMRFLVSNSREPGIYRELFWHGGGPPEIGDVDDRDANPQGILLLPLRTWSNALGYAAFTEQHAGAGRPAVVFGPGAGRPALTIGRRFIDDGGPGGTEPPATAITNVANIIAIWTFYAEFVAAATREGWQPGIFVTDLAAGSKAHNDAVKFRMAGPKPPVIAAGVLGAQYLAGIDSLLVTLQRPAHQALVQRAAETLRSARSKGSTLLVASCGHYLLDELARDTLATPFRHVEWRWDFAARLRERGAKAGDAMLWFGFGGYDCPHVAVTVPFAEAKLQVVTLTGPTAPPPGKVALHLPAHWRIPDGIVKIPFAPGVLGPTSSVEMGIHYLWLKRLVGKP